MVESDRYRDRKRPQKGPRPSGGAPAGRPPRAPTPPGRAGPRDGPRRANKPRPPPQSPPQSPSRAPPAAPGEQTKPRAPPNGPATRGAGRPKRQKAVRRAPDRRAKRAPAATDAPNTRAASATPARPATPSSSATPATPGNQAAPAPRAASALEPELKINRPPLWRVAWQWLREDPDRNAHKTERDRAVRKVEAESEAQRKTYMRDQLQRAKLGIVAGAVVTGDKAGAAAPRGKAAAGSDHRLWTRSEDAPPGRLASLIHKLLGERTRTDADGERVVVPPPETDFRWHLHRLFRSNQRAVVYARSIFVLLLLVSTVWFSVLQTTGFDLMDHMDAYDPEDERSRFRTPFFIIESGSMMHKDAPFGRIGTVDPGDLVVVEKVRPGETIETFYGSGSKHVAGGKGDVIMYLPVTAGEEASDPIIHRAMAYIHREEIRIPNPNPGPDAPSTVIAVRFTVEEFGIFEARSVNIPELGLRNYKPVMSGYITRGDNDRSNNWADQALGVTPFPVPEDRIIGRMKAEVPFIGLAKIALSGQEPALISADEAWCSFLAGQAACDTWLVFFVIVIVFVAVPLVITVFVFGRRAYVRYLDRAATRRAQDAELARRASERTAEGGAPEAASSLRPHDAADLLTGTVVVDGVPRSSGPTDWALLTRPGGTSWHDDDRRTE